MPRRDEVIQKVVKMLRLARNAGTEAEAHTALALAQKLMYAHELAEHELAGPEAAQPIDDTVVDEMGRHVDWKEYLAAIVAENFRCAYIISERRSSGAVRLVLMGRRTDIAVAREAYETAAIVAAHLAEQCAQRREPHERAAARASFLTGFLRGLCGRFDDNIGSTALVVIADPEVMAGAQAALSKPRTCMARPGGPSPRSATSASLLLADSGVSQALKPRPAVAIIENANPYFFISVFIPTPVVTPANLAHRKTVPP